MSKDTAKKIPIRPEALAPLPPEPVPLHGPITWKDNFFADVRGRPFTDLRISITDHCNFRCRYCRPREIWDDYRAYLPHDTLLTFEEIFRFARTAVVCGVNKIRLTGGEPLLRKGIESLIEKLRTIRTPDGGDIDIAITTNGSLLERKAAALKAAGLDRVTVSLDAITEEKFQALNDVGFPAAKVLRGIDAAIEAGFTGTKVNTVVERGVNEDELVPLLRHFEGRGVAVRFIEYMDTGNSGRWKMDKVVPTSEILRTVRRFYDLSPITPRYPGETAKRWRYGPSNDEFGCISSVTEPFCAHCSRMRLSMEGRLFLCLFAERGYDIRTPLRNGASVQELAEIIGRIWSLRSDHYSELRSSGMPIERHKIEMGYIGG